jgi:hypothetical protein
MLTLAACAGAACVMLTCSEAYREYDRLSVALIASAAAHSPLGERIARETGFAPDERADLMAELRRLSLRLQKCGGDV